MKIYKINADFDHYDSCRIDYEACAREHEFGENELLIDFDGTSKAEGWWPRIMVRDFGGLLGHQRSNSIRVYRPRKGGI